MNNIIIIISRLILILLIFLHQSTSLNIDGILLLSFKYSIINDPLNVLQSWRYEDVTPCSWQGVTCNNNNNTSNVPRVTSLSLPNSNLLGSIPADLPTIEFLQTLNLSNNSLNGSLPFSIFDARFLRFLDLSNNVITGELPVNVGRLGNLLSLNLSDNALGGKLPGNLAKLINLEEVSMKNNYLSGDLPGGFEFIRVLDLSSNLINGSLPSDFGGIKLRYFNISYNKLSGEIPVNFSVNIPENATLDLSFNSLTGEIPKAVVFTNQEPSSFAGNSDLCGESTGNTCHIPSSPANFPAPTSSPAIAAIPKPTEPSQSTGKQRGTGLRPKTIILIVIGDFIAVILIGLVFFYVYKLKKKKNIEVSAVKDGDWSTSSSESKGFASWSCLRKRTEEENNDNESETSTSDNDSGGQHSSFENQRPGLNHQETDKKGTLVILNGDSKIELETLLKASAYILGATGSSIMYKAVLEDGTCLAVRRIGETGVDRFRDFENQIRVISKLIHPNLVRIRGFYYGVDEKLVIYDFVPNGSLANARHNSDLRFNLSGFSGKVGSSPFQLPYKTGGSIRNFGSNRSITSQTNFQDFPVGLGPSPSPSPSSIGGISPYHAPESLRILKPHPKWDVYSFGVILLELLTGKVIVVDELGQGNGLAVEDGNRALRMADMAIRADLDGKEDALLAIFKLGFSCASPIPQKRPSMKEALQILEKFPTSSSSSYVYGH
ncbi:hypothetical protein ACFE04_003186 [Oxalis oulophora]